MIEVPIACPIWVCSYLLCSVVEMFNSIRGDRVVGRAWTKKLEWNVILPIVVSG